MQSNDPGSDSPFDDVPPDVARRLVRAFDRSPSTWTLLLDPDLTLRYLSRSAEVFQGIDPDRRIGENPLARVHPDDVGPLLHGLEQLRSAEPESTSAVPVVEPLRYRLERPDGSGWITVEAMVLNLLDDPVANGLVLVSRPVGGELDGIGHVLDLMVDDAPLSDVLAACARLVPGYLGCAAVVAFVDGNPVIGARSGYGLERLCSDDRWWRKAMTDGKDYMPLDFDGYPEDLAEQARALGYRSAWVKPLHDSSTGEVIGCMVVWVRIAVEYNVGTHQGLGKAALLARLVIGEQRTRHALRREAVTDPLTGVSNRSALGHRLEGAVSPLTVAIIDLDDFKPVNDTHGHETGDAVLRVVAERINGAVRGDDLVVRLGGDEFAIVFAEGTSSEGIAHSAKRITEAISQPIRLDRALRLTVSASMGVATAASGEVMQEADAALYRAKRNKHS